MYDISAPPIVRYVRERSGLTQRALAKKAETTQAVVARIESGDANPSVEMLRRLVHAAGLQLRLEVVEPRVSDPVVDAYKPGVDQTLLIGQLRKTPQQRINDLISAARTATEFRRAGREARLRVAEAEAKYNAHRNPR
jgi:transcriptional regulator with XRE-family HTH domain